MSIPTSAVREASLFPTPPRVRVVADPEHLQEALSLAEELDRAGAETELRFDDDAEVNSRVHPDAIVYDSDPAGAHLVGRSLHMAVVERGDGFSRERLRSAGFDVLLSRPVHADVLMRKLHECAARRG